MKLDFWLPLALAAGATVVSGELSCSACTTSAKVALTAFQKATYLLPSSFEEEIIDVMEDLICRRNMRDRYRSYEDGEKCLKMVEKGGSKALHLQNEDIVQISAEICHSFCDNTNITNGVKGKRNVVMTIKFLLKFVIAVYHAMNHPVVIVNLFQTRVYPTQNF
eukprot:Awhi_evm2s11624